MIVVVMGVSGCGKSTVGQALAGSLGWTFLDADDFHPPANVAKMAAGTPLNDDDRWPWLDRVAGELRVVNAAGRHAVLACSALRQASATGWRQPATCASCTSRATCRRSRRDRGAPASLHAGLAAGEPVRDAGASRRRDRHRRARTVGRTGRRHPCRARRREGTPIPKATPRSPKPQVSSKRSARSRRPRTGHARRAPRA